MGTKEARLVIFADEPLPPFLESGQEQQAQFQDQTKIQVDDRAIKLQLGGLGPSIAGQAGIVHQTVDIRSLELFEETLSAVDLQKILCQNPDRAGAAAADLSGQLCQAALIPIHQDQVGSLLYTQAQGQFASQTSSRAGDQHGAAAQAYPAHF